MGQVVAQPAAAPLAFATSDQGSQQYLTFTLNAEVFAIGILNIKEIIEYGTLTEIPMMPAFIRGVINLRGAVVPVVDLSARFGSRQTEVARRTCIVIVEMAQVVDDAEIRQDIGIVVDSVNEVLEIPPGEIEPPPSFGARIRADFIQGMGKVAGKFVIILNIDRVLSVDEMAQLALVGARLPTEEGNDKHGA
ncbi:purine-binding chemotaxis protein CheW [Pseudothauera nasutitermitis]|uniref:Purine-binding chemotaxis protein CheW n=1 Tax=Pseudothauera nasutitermitis TaxID=2565930 RepID=A0A4S4AT82_9RHOO|nr:chemotaxis protein CheW [Pseudothauera nasutitermitis]THF63062.1 purine-binding chemotaxis protein CheW [Pseudothauera nasutitermitis]